MICGQSNGEVIETGLCTLPYDRSSLGDPPHKGLARKIFKIIFATCFTHGRPSIEVKVRAAVMWHSDHGRV